MTKEEEAAEVKKKEEEEATAKKKEEEKGKGKEKTYTETQVKNAMSFVYNQNQELQDKLAEFEEAAKGKKETKKEERSADDLEVMSRNDFMNHILSEIKDTVVKPLSERIDKGDKQRASLVMEDQVDIAAKAHDDFWEFKDEIRALAKKNPDLPIDSLYALAKHENPDKVAALDKKLDEKKEETDKKEEEKKSAETFGGLLPTSGVTQRNTAMTSSDAAQAAADSVGLDDHLRAINRE